MRSIFLTGGLMEEKFPLSGMAWTGMVSHPLSRFPAGSWPNCSRGCWPRHGSGAGRVVWWAFGRRLSSWFWREAHVGAKAG